MDFGREESEIVWVLFCGREDGYDIEFILLFSVYGASVYELKSLVIEEFWLPTGIITEPALFYTRKIFFLSPFPTQTTHQCLTLALILKNNPKIS